VSGAAAATVRSVLGSGGRPLEPALGASLGARLGHDVRDVRIHTDGRAAASARALGARAFTVGRKVVFGQGAYRPDTRSGRGLIGHELAHVVQQRAVADDVGRLAVETSPRSPAEREADAVGAAIALGRPAPAISAAPDATLARKLVNEDAGGCGVCENAKLAGIQAHVRIQRYLRAQIPGVQKEFRLPKPSPGDTTPPDEPGGRLDLAMVTKDEVYIAEIKPAHAGGIAEGRKDLVFYWNLIKDNLTDPDLAERSPRLLDIADVGEDFFVDAFFDWMSPKCKQWLYLNKSAPGLYTYYCEPPGSALKATPDCKCREKDDKEKEKEKEKPEDKPKDPPIIADPRDRGRDQPRDEPRRQPEKQPEKQPDKQPERQPEKQPDKQPERQPDGKEKEPGRDKGDGKDKGNGEEKDKGNGKEKDKGKDRKRRPPFRPPPPEVTIPAALMVITALLAKKFGKKLAEKLVPGAAYAQAAILLAAFATGRAEASPNLEGLDTLEALDALAKEKGREVSPELKELLKANPALAKAMREAGETGKLDDAQARLAEETMTFVAEHADEFTDEEIEQILKQTGGAQIPGSDVTVERLKQVAEARRKGATAGKGGAATGTGEGEREGKGTGAKEEGEKKAELPKEPPKEIPKELRDRLAAAGPQVQRLWAGITGQAKGVPVSPELLEGVLRRVAVNPPLTAEEVDRLLAAVKAVEGADRAKVVKALDDALAAIADARRQDVSTEPGSGGAGRDAKPADPKAQQQPGGPGAAQAPAKQPTPMAERLKPYERIAKLKPVGAYLFTVADPKDFVYAKGATATIFFVKRYTAGLAGGETSLTVNHAAAKGMWNVTIGALEVHDSGGALVESLAETTADIEPIGGRPKGEKKAAKK
jgi:hypothetical protein